MKNTITLHNNQQVKILNSDQLIYDKIELLNTQFPNFISHIIRSNFPGKTKRVLSFKGMNLKNKRCCLSDQLLIDIEGVASIISSRDNISFDMTVNILNDKRTLLQQINIDAGEYTIALIGEKSDKMLCLQAYNVLNMFIKNKVNEHAYPFTKIVNDELVKTLSADVSKRFDLSVKYKKLSIYDKRNFEIYIAERTIPGIVLNYELIWSLMYNYNNIIKNENVK